MLMGRHHAGADVRVFEVLVVVFFYDSSQRLAESGKVRASLCRMLAVDKRVIFFPVLVTVGNDYFYVFSLQVDDRI